MSRPDTRLVARLAGAAAVAALAAPPLASPLAAQERDGAAARAVYGPGELTTPPRLVSPSRTARLVSRTYPESLKRTGTGGTVRLAFVIGPNGRAEPGTIEVVEAPYAALGDAAKSVAEAIEFMPGKREGQPVRSRVELPIVYKP
jgi:protein TonB